MHTRELDSHYLLDTSLAVDLYEQIHQLPVVDFFTRLSPATLQKDKKSEDIYDLWLKSDSIKQVEGQDGKQAFLTWAEQLQYQLLHPVYGWTHLELKRYWGIEEFLTKENAAGIYDLLQEKLQGGTYKPSYFLEKNRIDSLFVPTDLLDTLPEKGSYAHLSANIYPIFKPTQALIVDNPEAFNAYMNQLATHTGFQLDHYIDLLNALHHSMDLFEQAGCKMAHHRLELMSAEDFSTNEVNFIFHKIRLGHELLPVEKAKYRSALLLHLSEMYFERGWVQQFYLGTIRKLREQESGFDAMGDDETAWYLLRYLHALSAREKMPKTIFYHPNKSSLIASIASKFNERWGKGRIQTRPAWEHMTSFGQLERNLTDINFTGQLQYFAGMPSSAQTLPSLMRHDFFRRRICSFMASEAEKGYFPKKSEHILPLLRRILSEGGKNYFNN